jgi:hypothetical protein
MVEPGVAQVMFRASGVSVVYRLSQAMLQLSLKGNQPSTWLVQLSNT